VASRAAGAGRPYVGVAHLCVPVATVGVAASLVPGAREMGVAVWLALGVVAGRVTGSRASSGVGRTSIGPAARAPGVAAVGATSPAPRAVEANLAAAASAALGVAGQGVFAATSSPTAPGVNGAGVARAASRAPASSAAAAARAAISFTRAA
jgi:hypothetical protein